MFKRCAALALIIATSVCYADEDYEYNVPSVAGMAPKTGYSYAREPHYTYSWMPDPSYLSAFTEAAYNYPSQDTGLAYK